MSTPYRTSKPIHERQLTDFQVFILRLRKKAFVVLEAIHYFINSLFYQQILIVLGGMFFCLICFGEKNPTIANLAWFLLGLEIFLASVYMVLGKK